MKGNFFGILFFFCLVTPVATTFILLQYQKKQVKREVKWRIIAGIDKEELVLLKFTEDEKQTKLKWKHSKEFEYNDEMYDIVETEIREDTTYYWCWWDYEETKLNKQLDELVSFACGKNSKNQENQKRLIKFFNSLHFSEPSKRTIFDVEIKNVQNCTYQNFYLSVFNSPPVPPPETG